MFSSIVFYLHLFNLYPCKVAHYMNLKTYVTLLTGMFQNM
jgi:hypothetical protein